MLRLLILTCVLAVGTAYASTQEAFSPRQGATALVIRTIGQAQKSIDVAAYEFTARDIADALIAAKQRGVVVQVVLDAKANKKHHPAVNDMVAAGITIRLNGHYAIMHDKYMIIDGRTVETGSFNYTASAEHRNAENVIVVNDDVPLAKQYLDNWQGLWDEGQVPNQESPP